MDSAGSGAMTVITEDVEVVGTIKAGNALRLAGKLNGDLNCTSDVIIDKTANVKGNLSVNSATIEGQIHGNIVAKDRIELKAAARISGDVKAKRLTVEDGVSMVGKAEVNPMGAASGRTSPQSPKEGEGGPEDDASSGGVGETDADRKSGLGILGRK